jgi:hypothetical protein
MQMCAGFRVAGWLQAERCGSVWQVLCYGGLIGPTQWLHGPADAYQQAAAVLSPRTLPLMSACRLRSAAAAAAAAAAGTEAKPKVAAA